MSMLLGGGSNLRPKKSTDVRNLEGLGSIAGGHLGRCGFNLCPVEAVRVQRVRCPDIGLGIKLDGA